MDRAVLALADAVVVLHKLVVRTLADDCDLRGLLTSLRCIFFRGQVQIIFFVDRLNSVGRRVHGGV